MAEFSARRMQPGDADTIWAMIVAENADYIAGFTPFANADEFRRGVEEADQDVYRLILDDGRLAGFFMLRGLDAGYERPSFGVYVSSQAAGRGAARFALDQALAVCRERGVARIFLTVAETNTIAADFYRRAGFAPIGVNTKTSHIMMEREV